MINLSMANLALRLPENIPGDFFVDSTCIDCDACRQIAPATFAEDSEASFVYRQPETDAQLARAILEGRGAVMPPWRGTLSLEEAWAMARYLRTFVPGTEISRPDYSAPEKSTPLPQPSVLPKSTSTP